MRGAKLSGKEIVIDYSNKILTNPVTLLSKAFLKMKCYRAEHIYRELEESLHSTIGKTLFPNNILKILALAEDRRFFNHHGIDVHAIFRSTFSTFFLRKIQGASTIEMQLARVLRNDYEKTLFRKMREIVAANYISTKYEKNQIASLYLHLAYYGIGINKDSLLVLSNDFDNNLAEICKIISHIKYPNRLNPTSEWNDKVMRRAKYLQILYLQNFEQ